MLKPRYVCSRSTALLMATVLALSFQAIHQDYIFYRTKTCILIIHMHTYFTIKSAVRKC